MAVRGTIDRLPDELLLQVLEHLQSLPPSEIKARQEPSLWQTSSPHRHLKEASCVSRRWRRIVLPLLFTHCQLRLDSERRPEWSTCSVCGDAPSAQPAEDGFRPTESDAYHAHMIKDAMARPASQDPDRSLMRHSETGWLTYEQETLAWVSRFYHVLVDFLRFVHVERLASGIKSFVLFTDITPLADPRSLPSQVGNRKWRFVAAAAFWKHLLSVIDPIRIAIVAPPTELAYLTNVEIDTDGIWAFNDMKFHVLELRQDSSLPSGKTGPVEYNKLQAFPSELGGIAASSVLGLRPWTHIGLNEGSFLAAYGTYEFFERGAPSMVYSINNSIRASLAPTNEVSWPVTLHAVRSFQYTAIFPFANHTSFDDILPFIEELDIQYAPDPQSSLLDDKMRVGRAELEDCWQELLSAYRKLVRLVETYAMSAAHYPLLKKIVCRDFQIRALKPDLDEEFVPLCLPVWAEYEPGVFTRLAMSPTYFDGE